MLAGLFALFNIGIPVVIATCSMPAMMNGTCPMCEGRDVPTTPTLVNDMSKACCTSTVVASPSKVEFMQARTDHVAPVIECGLLPVLDGVPSTIDHGRMTTVLSASPPVAVDIPILVSSLLI